MQRQEIEEHRKYVKSRVLNRFFSRRTETTTPLCSTAVINLCSPGCSMQEPSLKRAAGTLSYMQ